MGNQYSTAEQEIIDHLKTGKLTNEDYDLALTRHRRAKQHDATPGEIEIDRVWNRRQADDEEARRNAYRTETEAKEKTPEERAAAYEKQWADHDANWDANEAAWQNDDTFDKEGGDNHPDQTPQYDTIGNKRHGTY